MKKTDWTKLSVIFPMTFICCFLWGSAFPSVKIGYKLFSIASDDQASQLLFAGARFTLSGILVLLFGSIGSRRLILPRKSAWKYVFPLALVQTAGQYFFFYIGLAHTSGVKSSIIVAASTFFAIFFAVFLFHQEVLTAGKVIGCLIGFSGVVLIQMSGGGPLELSFAPNGEGFILLSAIMYALSSGMIKNFSRTEDPVTLSGSQFFAGGLILIAAGLFLGGRLTPAGPASILLLLYMAMISAVAYSLWSVLLKYNPVSRITVYGFLNPVIGVILSAVLLGEQNQAFSIYGLISLLLVSLGIVIVNRSSGKRYAQTADNLK